MPSSNSFFQMPEKYLRKTNLIVSISFALLIGLAVGYNTILAIALLVVPLSIFILIKKPYFYFYLYIFSIPFEGIALAQDISLSKIAGLFALTSFILLIITKQIKITWSKIDVLVLLYFLFAYLSLFWTSYFELSLTSIFILLRLLISYFIITNFASTYEKVITIFYAYSTGCIFSIIYALATNRAITAWDKYRLYGSTGDPNEFVQILVIALPFLVFSYFSYKRLTLKISSGGAILLMVTAILLSGSRGGLLWLACSGICTLAMCIKNKYKSILILATIIFYLATVFIPASTWQRYSTIRAPMVEGGHAVTSRLFNYKAAVEMISEHPLGVGLRNFQELSLPYGAIEANVVHNIFLEIFTGMGIQGGLIFLLIIYITIKQLFILRDANSNTLIPDSLLWAYISFLFLGMFLSSDLEKTLFLIPAITSGLYKGARSKDRRKQIAYQQGNRSNYES